MRGEKAIEFTVLCKGRLGSAATPVREGKGDRVLRGEFGLSPVTFSLPRKVNGDKSFCPLRSRNEDAEIAKKSLFFAISAVKCFWHRWLSVNRLVADEGYSSARGCRILGGSSPTTTQSSTRPWDNWECGHSKRQLRKCGGRGRQRRAFLRRATFPDAGWCM